MVICDYCEKTQEEAKIIITGNRGAGICEECIFTCVGVVTDRLFQGFEQIKLKRVDTPED